MAMFKRTRRPPREEPPFLPLWDDASGRAAVRLGNAQDIGRRQDQQDAFGWSAIPYGCGRMAAVLSDGMGGLADGARLSREVVAYMIGHLAEDGAVAPALETAVDALNERVLHENGLRGVAAGATLCLAVVARRDLYWLCVGDSRLYLLRGGRLHAINRDHNAAERLLTAYFRGEIALDEWQRHSGDERLTSYIGGAPLADVDMNRRPFRLQDADKLLLCSDGVYRALAEEEITEILREDPQTAADELIQRSLAKRLRGQDNLTAMLIEYAFEERVEA